MRSSIELRLQALKPTYYINIHSIQRNIWPNLQLMSYIHRPLVRNASDLVTRNG